MINNKKTLFFLFVAFLLSGFFIKAQAETGLAGSENDKQAKHATPPAGSALIYVFRDEDPPVEATVPVVLDGQRIGQTRPRTFLLATVAPGTHYLISGDKVIANLSVECQAGMTYFISQKALGGTYPVRTRLAVANPEAARRTIDRSTLAASRLAAAKTSAPSAAPSSSESGDRSKPAASPEKMQRGLALILKTGRFNMSDRSQVVGGLQSQFDSKATGVLGAELEWRDRSGFAFGGELYRFTNKIVAVGTSLEGEMEAVAFLANAKKYFEITGLLYPYVGAGLGVATNNFSGNVTGSASGPAYQAMAGIEFRMKNVGVYTELKYLFSSTEDSAGAKTKIGGNGKNLGIGVSFGF
jgi:opacity protein-like surface antigen